MGLGRLRSRLPLRLLFRARLVPRERAPSRSVPGERRL
jgi:hypothetical protein